MLKEGEITYTCDGELARPVAWQPDRDTVSGMMSVDT
jgi:hypothetical protein